MSSIITAAYELLLHELNGTLIRLNSNSSGLLAETMFQLLPDELFEILGTLTSSGDQEQESRDFVIECAQMIGRKQGVTITMQNLAHAIGHITALIHVEHRRRHGLLEYRWPDDIFSDPKSSGYSALTEKGKATAYKQILAQAVPLAKFIN